ncbi:MAG: PAS domain-containing protein [Chloroflexi bacterium]|nr:PAS domain-containing protein [Chloroflexota bacterium]
MRNTARPSRWRSRRPQGDFERALDRRFGLVGSVVVGIAVGWAAIALKASLNELFGNETGYIVLIASIVLAAWLGGLVGGLSATLFGFVLNPIIFPGPEDSFASAQAEQLRQVLSLLAGVGIAILVGTGRAARDRLADALDEVASLAAGVEARDTRLEIMLAASGTGFWEWDIATGELLWSEAIFRQHGLEPAPKAPSLDAYLELIHPDDREAFRLATRTAIETGRSFAVDFRLVWADGSIHWMHNAGRPFFDDDGRPTRMIGTGQDVTRRRRVEEERDRLLAEERRAGEFREAFIDVISHELRTPITTILGLTEILARPGRPDDRASRSSLLEDVRAESERLHRLVEDLLVLSRVERGALVVEAEPLEPRRLIERIVAHEAAQLPSLDILLEIEPDLPIVAGEDTYVEQILRNLLGNAAKYTPAGTHVLVDARQEGEQVMIRVIDDGPGIPQASIDRIFELFFRDPESARQVSGSGIGLFVCASLAEAMGGRMWGRRGPQGGSEFGFTMRSLKPDAMDAADGSLDAADRAPAIVDGRADAVGGAVQR